MEQKSVLETRRTEQQESESADSLMVPATADQTNSPKNKKNNCRAGLKDGKTCPVVGTSG